MSWEGCRPQPILLILLKQFSQLQIPSSPFCNRIIGFTHHGLQFLDFFSWSTLAKPKKVTFFGHLGPLPGLVFSGFGPSLSTWWCFKPPTFIPERLPVETSDWSPPHLWGHFALGFGTSCLGIFGCSAVAPVVHQSPWQKEGPKRVGGSPKKSDGFPIFTSPIPGVRAIFRFLTLWEGRWRNCQ